MAVAPATICKVGKIASAQQSILEYLEQKKNTRTHIRSQQKKHHTQNCPLCALNIGLFRRSGYDGEFRLHVIGETDPSNAWGGWRRLDIFFQRVVAGTCVGSARTQCVPARACSTGGQQLVCARMLACLSAARVRFPMDCQVGREAMHGGKRSKRARLRAHTQTCAFWLRACKFHNVFFHIFCLFFLRFIFECIYILPSFPRRSSAHNTRTHNAIHTPSTMVNGLDIGDFNSFWLLVVHFVCERLN